ncbi:hypothetical protein R50072_07780 [Simiduia litorea]
MKATDGLNEIPTLRFFIGHEAVILTLLARACLQRLAEIREMHRHKDVAD